MKKRKKKSQNRRGESRRTQNRRGESRRTQKRRGESRRTQKRRGESNKERDKEKETFAINNGYKFIRISSNDFKNIDMYKQIINYIENDKIN